MSLSGYYPTHVIGPEVSHVLIFCGTEECEKNMGTIRLCDRLAAHIPVPVLIPSDFPTYIDNLFDPGTLIMRLNPVNSSVIQHPPDSAQC